MRSALRIPCRRGSSIAWWVAVLALAVAGRARAQTVTFDAATTRAATGTSLILAHDVGTGRDRYLLVAISAASKVNALSVEVDGRPLTRLGTRATADPQWICTVELWGLVAPASGSRGVQVSFPSGVSTVVSVASYAGVDPRNPTGPFVAHDSWGSVVSMTFTSAPGELVADSVCAHKYPRAPSATPGAGQLELYDLPNGAITLAGSMRAGGSGIAQLWTFEQGNSANWAIAAVALRPATGLPPGTGGAGGNPGTGGASGNPSTGGTSGGASGGATGDAPADGALVDGTPLPSDAVPADQPLELGAGEVAPADMPPVDLRADRADGAAASSAPASVAYRVSCACRLGGHGPAPALLTPLALALAALAARRRR